MALAAFKHNKVQPLQSVVWLFFFFFFKVQVLWNSWSELQEEAEGRTTEVQKSDSSCASGWRRLLPAGRLPFRGSRPGWFEVFRLKCCFVEFVLVMPETCFLFFFFTTWGSVSLPSCLLFSAMRYSERYTLLLHSSLQCKEEFSWSLTSEPGRKKTRQCTSP